ncbi:DNA-processing protein DprA [Rubrivirga sp. IMCC45206]|uniref:DNA-processing protein DprA n=1 Tax=Rubrivirga sp. IMCC45206 TaxID=3391614 RepID=UPI00398FCD95
MSALPTPAPFALALLSLDGVGRVTAHRLLERFASPEAVRAAPREQVLLRLKGVAHAAQIVDAVCAPAFDDALDQAAAQVEALAGRRIAVLAPGDDRWPSGLDALDRADRPAVLYAFGDLAALRWPSLSVLASAPLAAPPFEAAQAVARGVLERGRGLVVGAAHGVDLALQKLSLGAGVPAVAVVGAGLARIDRSMRPGATALTKGGGLMVSPFPMAHGPFDHDDRERAMVQAALGRAVLAVTPPAGSHEARAAAWAADAERPLFLVPPAPADAPWAEAARPADDAGAVAETVA